MISVLNLTLHIRWTWTQLWSSIFEIKYTELDFRHFDIRNWFNVRYSLNMNSLLNLTLNSCLNSPNMNFDTQENALWTAIFIFVDSILYVILNLAIWYSRERNIFDYDVLSLGIHVNSFELEVWYLLSMNNVSIKKFVYRKHIQKLIWYSILVEY